MARANSWTDQQISILKQEFPLSADLRGLAAQLGRTLPALKTKARLLKVGRQTHGSAGWTPEKINRLIELYPSTRNIDIGAELGFSEGSISGKAFKLKLKKPPDFIYEHSKKGMFKKGIVPANKGRKQSEYMSQEMIERTKATRFKPGQKVYNEAFDGAIRIRNDHPDRNGGLITAYIRLSKGKWKELHINNWEKVNGPVPKGSILACIDGNRLNCEPSNWQIITRADNMKRNSAQENLTDGYIINCLAGKQYRSDKEFKEELAKMPELIEAKRLQLILKRQINETTNREETTADA